MYVGVEVVEIDSKNHKVTVKGAKADPIKVVERVRKKSCKHVELISPVLSTDKKEENIGDKKQEVSVISHHISYLIVVSSDLCSVVCSQNWLK